ncbi:Uncharacterized protein FWK35_00010905, partial [Aphis craccivora]
HSIISQVSKLFESIVLNTIQPIINSIIINEQHGFRLGRSTSTCNAVLCNHIFKAFYGFFFLLFKSHISLKSK